MNNFEKINIKNEVKFEQISNKEKAIFLPQCLRSTECTAKVNKDGILCVNCGKCEIGHFKKESESLGYNVFIVPGGSLVKKLVEKYNFKAALGIACQPELEQGIEIMNKKGLPSISIKLLKDGCVNTEVDWKEVRKTVLK